MGLISSIEIKGEDSSWVVVGDTGVSTKHVYTNKIDALHVVERILHENLKKQVQILDRINSAIVELNLEKQNCANERK